MTACTEHEPVWAEAALAFECARCGAALPATTGRCSCGKPLDEHSYFRNVGTQSEPVMQVAARPICPGGKP